MKVLIGGDTVPTESNISLFQCEDITQLVGIDLHSVIQKHDYFVLNLETPLICEDTPIQKSGPVLGVNQSAINGYKKMQVNAVSLANNHIYDHGSTGLRNTIEVLDRNSIFHFGAGLAYEEMTKCHFAIIGDVKLGFYSCCENEFSTLTPRHGGANAYDALETFDHIRKLSKECDHLIVLYHGGKEEYRYPTPLQQRIMRKMADCGARLVVAQHSHCIGCKEEYHGTTLVYGQGNFIFDESTNSCWDNGLLLSIEIDNGCVDVHFIPVVRKNGCIRIASTEEADAILEDFHRRSEEIMTEGFVEKSFAQKALSQKSYLLRKMHGDTAFTKVLSKLFPNYLNKFCYNGKKRNAALNLVRCESHRETLETILKS